ncbi:MAG: hypothetical protein AAFN63_01635 [Pseudomonadota bacterium]
MRETLLSILLDHFQPPEAMAWLDCPNDRLDGLTPGQVIVERGYDEVILVAQSLKTEETDPN